MKRERKKERKKERKGEREKERKKKKLVYCPLRVLKRFLLAIFGAQALFIEDTWRFAYGTCSFCKHYFAAKFTEYYSIR